LGDYLSIAAGNAGASELVASTSLAGNTVRRYGRGVWYLITYVVEGVLGVACYGLFSVGRIHGVLFCRTGVYLHHRIDSRFYLPLVFAWGYSRSTIPRPQTEDIVFAFEQIGRMKHVFLTGASFGIGLATAQALLASGHEVWGTSRDPNRLPQLNHLHHVQLDLRDNNKIDEAFMNSLDEAGHFDVLINNAGSGHFGPAESLSAEIISNQFQVLVFGHIRLMQLALAAMRARGKGLIINVSSLAGRLPVPFMSAYNAAKAAMASFTMSSQLELLDSNVRIIDLQPADICTPFNDAVTKSKDYDPRYEANLAKTWNAVERNIRDAPKPDLVARRVCELIDDRNPPPRVRVGDAFQTKIAPLIFRFLPQRVRIWGLRKYYGI